MTEAKLYGILLYLGRGEKISDVFLKSNGYSDEEINELVDLNYIIYVGTGEANNKKYIITDKGRAARNR